MGELTAKLERAAHLVGSYLDSTAEKLNLTQGEAHVLAQLDRRGPLAIAALHDAFGHKRSTLTNILDRLENRKLLRRELNRDDRRSFIVSLTPQGRRTATQVTEVLDGLERQLAGRLKKAEIEGMANVIAALEDIVRRGRDGVAGS